MRLNYNTVQIAPNEFSATFIGDKEGLEALANALMKATRDGISKVVIQNSGVPTTTHLLIDCTDSKPEPGN